MSRDENDSLTPGWLSKKLTAIRKAMKESRIWLAESASHLLDDLTQASQESIEEGDYEVLALVVNDALEGVDISRRYPAYYQKMLANPQLFEAFLDMVEVLEADRAGQLASLPEKPTYDLSFLDKSTPLPVVTQKETGQWIIIWQQAAEKLQSLFTTFGFPPLAYRGAGLLEEEYFTLLRGKTTAGKQTVDVMLEATLVDNPVNTLQLLLTLAVLNKEAPPGEELPDVQATLQWGSYNETISVDKYGRGTFSPLPLQAITNTTDQIISSGFQLSLELISGHPQ